MLLKLQIIIFLLAGVQSMEKEQWARHVVLIFYTDGILLTKGVEKNTYYLVEKPLEYFQERIPNCFGTLLTDNHILTGATCAYAIRLVLIANDKKYAWYLDEFELDNWRIVKVLNPTIFRVFQRWWVLKSNIFGQE